MVTITKTYSDYNGVERTESFSFNLNEAELTEMELGTAGTFTSMVQSIVDAKDTPSIMAVFKDLLMKSYGRKTPDGRRFEKSPELSKEFSETPAYSMIYMELATDDTKAADFINQLIPKSLAEAAQKQNAQIKALPSVEK